MSNTNSTMTEAQITALVAERVAAVLAENEPVKTTKSVEGVVSQKQAAKLVAEGANPWKVLVKSNTTGNAIPFAKVARAKGVKAGTVKLRETSRSDNKALAAELRELGLEPTGKVWAAYKAGERSKAKLSRLAG